MEEDIYQIDQNEIKRQRKEKFIERKRVSDIRTGILMGILAIILHVYFFIGIGLSIMAVYFSLKNKKLDKSRDIERIISMIIAICAVLVNVSSFAYLVSVIVDDPSTIKEIAKIVEE